MLNRYKYNDELRGRMKWYKIVAFNSIIALLLHITVFMLVEDSYCSGELHFLLQPFYPIYAIKPFQCEYKQVEPILSELSSNNVVDVYYYFREHYMLNYKNRQPPFFIVTISRNVYGSFKNSDNYTVQTSFFVMTARDPPKSVLSTKSGDCDDYSATLYIVYKLLGYDVKLVLVKLRHVITGKSLQHEVVVVRVGGNYYLIDGVNDFLVISSNPDDLLDKYEGVLLYYTVENYWVFGESFLPSKRL